MRMGVDAQGKARMPLLPAEKAREVGLTIQPYQHESCVIPLPTLLLWLNSIKFVADSFGPKIVTCTTPIPTSTLENPEVQWKASTWPRTFTKLEAT